MVRVRVRGASKFDPHLSDEGVIGTERNPDCSRDVSAGLPRTVTVTRTTVTVSESSFGIFLGTT